MPARARSTYDPHPIVESNRELLANLADRTGRSESDWLALAATSGKADEETRRQWLMAHGLGGGQAELVALLSLGRCRELVDPVENVRWASSNVEALYAGDKAALRPIHDELERQARKLGRDVRIAPLRTHVPLFRGTRLFAQIRPATRTRVDLALVLPDIRGSGDLTPLTGARSKSAPTHRIALSAARGLDAVVMRWLRRAYEAAA